MKRAVRRALLLSALAAPSALYALGLGEIRLNSALNQPFDADIELVSATSEDLGALRAALASGETFERYGLDKPSFLSDFTFRVARSGGRDVLKVTSPRPVTEPFVTLLVEASWPRGRLLREYTVLLDPPVFSPAPVAGAAPVETPRAAAAPMTPSPAPRPAPAVPDRDVMAPPRTVIEPGSTYRVRPNDTLWRIASAANPGPRSEVNRMMVAIYEANPAAFGGNINVLLANSELRIPTGSDVAAISASAAADEVARQYRQWSEGGTSAAALAQAEGRLRLVTPEQGAAAAALATPPAPAAVAPTDAAMQDRLQRLEAELAETRRLLEVRNAELATLQGSAPAVEPGAVVEPAAPAPADVIPPETEATAPAAAAEPEVAPAPKPARKPPPVEAPEPSLFERLQGYWWVLLGLLAAALGVAAWLRRRRSSPQGDSLEEALGRRASEDLRSSPVVTSRSAESNILVEERRPAESLAPVAAASTGVGAVVETSRRPATVEDTLSGDGAASIEAGDPLAEADFHMAYGLYDQAAELVQVAAKREPQRRDLKLKLVEIFFVWGNRERFLEVAREMHATRAQAEPGEWDKIQIMGRQLTPDEPLFAGAAATVTSDLDLELFGGAASTDFELPGGDSPPPDLDLTVQSPEVRGGDSLDFLIDEPLRGTEVDAMLSPTVEAPRARTSVDEQTAEVPIEELGLDTSALKELDEITQLQTTLVEAGPVIEDTVQEPQLARGATSVEDTVQETHLAAGSVAFEDTVQEPYLARPRAPVEDTVQAPMLGRGGVPAETEEVDLLSTTSMLKLDLDTLAQKVAGEEGVAVVDLTGMTGELPALDQVDIDATGEVEGIDAKVAGDITMSEVGTKLDLARAYVDMGDPEGARSILEEVLKEGSAAHKQEAERLMAVLP
jgi:pilus assembly protein FimV